MVEQRAHALWPNEPDNGQGGLKVKMSHSAMLLGALAFAGCNGGGDRRAPSVDSAGMAGHMDSGGDGRHADAWDAHDVWHAGPHRLDDGNVAPANAGQNGWASGDDVSDDGRDGCGHARHEYAREP